MRKKIVALLVAVIFAGSSLIGSVSVNAGDKMTCEENLHMLKDELRNLPTIEDFEKAIENDEFTVDASQECITYCWATAIGTYAMCVLTGGDPILCLWLAIAFHAICITYCE